MNCGEVDTAVLTPKVARQVEITAGVPDGRHCSGSMSRSFLRGPVLNCL